MNLRQRAAAIISNNSNELLVLRQKNPHTGFKWWTLPGYDPEVEVQSIEECRFISEDELKTSSISIFPPVFKEQFWIDLKSNFQNHEVCQRGQTYSKN